MPYFHLEFNQKINSIDTTNGSVLEFPITLINIGKETATNISLQTWTDKYHNLDYFKVDGFESERHGVRSYFDRQYAVAGKGVNISAACAYHEEAYNVRFKIHYNDLVGRCYEQEFRFQYCYKISDDFSMNHTTNPPICVKDE